MSTSNLQGQPPPSPTTQTIASPNDHIVQTSADQLTACQICTNPKNQEMICCSICHAQFHKSCTNANASSLTDWQCQACHLASPTYNSSAKAPASNVSRSSQPRRVALELQRAEEERKLALAELAINKEFLRKKYQILAEECEENESKSSQSVSVNAWLEGQREFANSNSTIIPQKMPNINSGTQKDLHDSHSMPTGEKTDTNLIEVGESVRFSLPSIQQATKQPPITTITSSQPQGVPDAPLNNVNTYLNTAPLVPNATEINRITNTNSTFCNVPASLIYSSRPSEGGCIHPQNVNTQDGIFPASSGNLNSNSFTSSTQIACSNLTKEQIQARHSVPKELPIFSGQPEEWPVFSSTFDWSTMICGLTDAENLLRMQRCLRGEALRSVQHILVHPSCVPAAISTLKLLFGQPEKILQSIKIRIKSTPPINTNKLESFTTFAINVKSLIATIEACGLQDELNNSSLLQELIEKMPTQYQLIWGTHKLDLLKLNQRPNLLEFSNWIFNFGLSASSVTVTTNVSASENNIRNKTKNAFINAHREVQQRKCYACKMLCKNVANCEYFLKADRGERWNIVRKNNLCKQCLYPHAYRVCKSEKKCGVNGCSYNHHALLHRFFPEVNKHDERDGALDEINVNAHSELNHKTLFKILPITVYGKNKTINTFAFIDEGSSVSLCEEDLAIELELEGTLHPLCLKWTGHVQRTENTSKRIAVTISGIKGRPSVLEVHTVRKLSLPTQTLNYEELSAGFQHLQNLPISSFKNATPQLLIGANHWSLGIPKEIRENKSSEPVAVRTELGWLIYGGGKDFKDSFNLHICVVVSKKVTLEEDRGITLLKKHTKRRIDNHFETGLLWRFDEFSLPESITMAKNRLQCLERKLKRQPELLEVFRRTIKDYLLKGYIRKLPLTELNPNVPNKTWYLPIFAVFNKNKPGKARVVWDAAAKSHGVSLNSLLIKGPDLLTSLPAILFRFRERSIAICGDIEQMFHQIFIRPEDQDVQRFLWRDGDDAKQPDVYVMNVMIFGASCAPSTSQFVKNLNASEFEGKFPEAAKAIKEDHYVDDFLKSVDTVQEAIKLVADIKFVHKQGGFNIRKWTSNSNEVVLSIEEDQSMLEKSLELIDEPAVEKVLGVFWIPKEDMITFKTSSAILQNDIFLGKRPPTKREMLRILMSIYDPLGLIGNFLMYLKILLQEVWRSAVNWDEPILNAQAIKWIHWVQLIPSLQTLRIPRCHLRYFTNYDGIETQLHTFVDASQNGYAAVCYIRISDGQRTSCSLIGSKTRVAPLKIVSIPRLELMAAVIGSRFAKYILDSHSIRIVKHFYWSDSRTVLSWLRAADHRQYHQFVAFRVCEILDNTELNEWRWIPTKLNIADEATKWSKTPDITQSSRWFTGPIFLEQEEANWPKEDGDIISTDLELKHQILHISIVNPLFKVHRFSKWIRLLRTGAYVFRYALNLKRKKDKCPLIYGEITQEELKKAEALLYRQAQQEEYGEYIDHLRSGKRLKRSSVLYQLSPYLDGNDLLRADGRIDNAKVPETQKQPIILPKNNYVTSLILMHYHTIYHHLNHETAINELRKTFHIANIRTTYKKEVKMCQKCKIDKAMPRPPQMAKLPPARLASFAAPFTFTGLDFFGPLTVSVGRHTEKRYGALFTCLTIRAVHIEMVYSLNTSSCILAIRNFMARRGIPREFYSDNGTNFVGAERELREAIKEVDENALIRKFTTTTTKWNFNPPAAPHMGGAWERLVRSIKTVLYKIAPSRAPSDELLRSMLIEVENIVNTRPLAYIPIENDTTEALTPNHFLLGSSNGIKPIATYNDDPVVLKSSWLMSQQFAENFWRKWLSEYLPSLTLRTKWHEKIKPLCVGDLVVVVDPKCPRNVWPRGKIVEVRTAKDGQVRSAKVLTTHGILERPSTKIAILDVAARKE
ncbi:uncharacterized protein LOC129954075 [Eupeodes corollae]|uniref:uncharacterized protein LOC129954075 n=1 Tax=Eupeodes corollae TaxID=290404 RepID=UPI0024913185|nr:uncharacterized protein LOC129954075 [Eupeodes corollae]